MATSDSVVATTDEHEHRWLTERRFFVIMALMLLAITSVLFDGDLPAFFWSLIVLGGSMWYE